MRVIARLEPEPPRGGRPGRRGPHARRADRPLRRRRGATTRRVALPVLIHGDAAFAGQGVVAETLNLQDLAGYSTGGTLHLIANNQIGFTTDPEESRSTRYSSDLAKGFDVPIIHVNADDPEAALAAIRLAMAYRAQLRPRRGRRPRRLPALRPQRAGRGRLHAAADGRAIEAHPPVRELYARAARRRRASSRRRRPTRSTRDVSARLRAAHERLKETLRQRVESPRRRRSGPRTTATVVETAVAGRRCAS